MTHAWVGEVRFAIRSLRKSPGFTGIAVAALALGIGANTAIFSAVHALMLGPMPYSHPEQLVAVWEDSSLIGFPKNTPAPANYFDWRRMNHSFTDMAALRWSDANLTGAGRPEMILGRKTTANFFGILGTKPLMGRTYTESEDRTGAKVVVINFDLWQRQFGGDRQVIGRVLHMNNEPFTVIGVMPRGFAYPDRRFEYWQPANFTPQEIAQRDYHNLAVVARLKPGVSVREAQTDMSGIAKRLERSYPDTNGKLGAVVVSLRNDLAGDTGTALAILLGAAVMVLAIACANVANLLLIRGADRQRELAVRAALGASRGQIVRQLLIESGFLAAAGTAVGLCLAEIGTAVLQAMIPADLVMAAPLALNAPVLCFAIALSVVSVMVFGLVPSVQSSRLDVNTALKQGGRTVAGASGGLRKAFVVVQVALALVLVTGAGLLVETLGNLKDVPMGFPPDHLLSMVTRLSPQVYNSDAKILSFTNRVVKRLKELPGIQGAGFASNIPLTAMGNTSGFRIEGRPESRGDQFNDALYREVSSGYMRTLGAQVLAGRLIEERDTLNSQPVIVINETFARQYWPGGNALGAHMVESGSKKLPWRTVIGIVRDIRERGLQLPMKPAMYLPMTQVQHPGADFVLVRTAADPAAVVQEVRQAIEGIDPDQPVAMVRTMEDYINLELSDHAEQMRILAIFAGLALFLAALGIYGVLAYLVAQRRKEIGVRIALGASATAVTGLVIRQGLVLTACGLIFGLVLAAALTRAMQALLFGVRSLDPATLAFGAGALLVAAASACFAPAASAARVNPISALRDE